MMKKQLSLLRFKIKADKADIKADKVNSESMKGEIGWSMDCVWKTQVRKPEEVGGRKKKKAYEDSHTFTEQRESRLTTIPKSELFPSQRFLWSSLHSGK